METKIMEFLIDKLWRLKILLKIDDTLYKCYEKHLNILEVI